jgi:Holliday junction resolvase RusA-like endonuclease
MKAEFTVPGIPVAKGRPRFSRQGNFVRTFTPEKTYNYEQLVKLAFMQAGCEKLSGAVKVRIIAYFPIPKSTSKKRQKMMAEGEIRHMVKPDAENVSKGILDALNKLAYDDDSNIIELHIEKWYSENPRAEIYIEEA